MAHVRVRVKVVFLTKIEVKITKTVNMRYLSCLKNDMNVLGSLHEPA